MNNLILFEDAHLLVVHKPSGINTHKPDRFAPDGLHEWLTRREPRWANLSILHRLDKDTSGVLLFGKTRLANQSLARQFETHKVQKTYVLLTTAKPSRVKFVGQSPGATTEFEYLEPHGRVFVVQARPITGKTHQIRRHAAYNGFPILGDTEYEGEPAPRLMLHAQKLQIAHPKTGERLTFEASIPAAFDDLDALTAAREFRELLFDNDTTAHRLVSSAADGIPDVIVDSFDGRLLVQWQTELAAKTGPALRKRLVAGGGVKTIHEQLVTKQKRAAPRCVWPVATAEPSGRFLIRENGLDFWIGFGEGLAPGIFLDQRENRRRLLKMNLAGRTLLNCFAYTCAFSVAAARAGALTTSVDLSSNYLDWGMENFLANNFSIALKRNDRPGPEQSAPSEPSHEFVCGDVFEWLRRFAQRGRTWDLVLLDPPTFSTSKKGRAFQAERDYVELATQAVALVAPGGTLFCSTNQRTLAPEKFEETVRAAARQGGRVIGAMEFATLPFDFRVAPGSHPYLKTIWATIR